MAVAGGLSGPDSDPPLVRKNASTANRATTAAMANGFFDAGLVRCGACEMAGAGGGASAESMSRLLRVRRISFAILSMGGEIMI